MKIRKRLLLLFREANFLQLFFSHKSKKRKRGQSACEFVCLCVGKAQARYSIRLIGFSPCDTIINIISWSFHLFSASPSLRNIITVYYYDYPSRLKVKANKCNHQPCLLSSVCITLNVFLECFFLENKKKNVVKSFFCSQFFLLEREKKWWTR